MTAAAQIDDCFAADYCAARRLFLDAASAVRGSLTTYTHPLSASDGTALALDTLYLGPADASRLLIMTSGTHGIELLPGSACQVAHLRAGRFSQLPPSVGVLLVHALNPWGAAHSRRNTEDNVDLCRNFMDFAQALPVNEDYDSLHDALNRATTADVDDFMADATARLGHTGFLNALMRGQYRHAGGFSFGGQRPTWSNDTISTILKSLAAHRKRVCIVDYHSGVGPYGYGSAVCLQTGAALESTRGAFGGWVIAPRELAESRPQEFYTVHGHAADGYARAVGRAKLSTIVLEFGTYSSGRLLRALLLEHVARFNGDDRSMCGDITSQISEMHNPGNTDWRLAILSRADQVVDQAIRWLSA